MFEIIARGSFIDDLHKYLNFSGTHNKISGFRHLLMLGLVLHLDQFEM